MFAALLISQQLFAADVAAACPQLERFAPRVFEREIGWGRHRAKISGAGRGMVNLGHSLNTSRKGTIRFEVRNSTQDRGLADSETVRRSELAFSRVRSGKNTVLWDAFGVLPEAYADPASMMESSGGLFSQMKTDGPGSPVLGMRRTRGDKLQITTRAIDEPGLGETLFEGEWKLGVPHYFVRRMVFGSGTGQLDVWMDGRKIVSARNIRMGSSNPANAPYPKLGAYYSRGLGSSPCSRVVNEFANYREPTTTNLSHLIKNPPPWPR